MIPRKKHSHRCRSCGYAVYCYKTRCTKPQKIERCGWCRPLPGMERVAEERAAVVAVEQGEELTAILASPKANVDAKVGEMETRSPLFRGNGPQGELFS